VTLLARVNAVLVLALALACVACWWICASLLKASTEREVLQQAALMIDSALATRAYTANEIRPLLVEQMRTQFLPQSVPSYAATQHFIRLREQHPQYSYKEATLNPTNPRDHATDWESDIIQRFRNAPNVQEIHGIRDTPLGPALYLAKPIRATGDCLACHGLASEAPATLLARYGSNNGFGWQPDEVIGAQIVAAPLAAASSSVDSVLRGFTTCLIASSLVILAVVNLVLYRLVIQPLHRISRIADQLSVSGGAGAEPFPAHGTREILTLSESFNRLRASLEKALKLLGA
jgi:HAMP domain-containing protein